jgi:hypothetical protein
MKFKKIVTILPIVDRGILMQLRDNKKEISHPNRWGYFSGSFLNLSEDYFMAAKREISEELSIQNVKNLKFLYSYIQNKKKIIYYIFYIKLEKKNLLLKEGADFDIFFKNDFLRGKKKSKKKNKIFNIAEDEVIKRFYNKLNI